jgi:hypothetical protein
MRTFIVSSLRIAAMLLLGTPAAFACDQGASYCNNSYVYTCECWTGQGCYYAYSGYSANCGAYDKVPNKLQNLQTPNPPTPNSPTPIK